MVLDGGKGAIAVLLVKAFLGADATLLALVAGTAAVFGHNFPVWLKFKGGKGVATTLGLMLAALPIVAIMAMLTWLAVAAIFRISSLSGLLTFAAAPLYALMLGRFQEAIAFGVLGVLGWIRHASNIKRLIKGEEPRIGKK
jgi:glycerol-3-phosphate acyltransferase PlsY